MQEGYLPTVKHRETPIFTSFMWDISSGLVTVNMSRETLWNTVFHSLPFLVGITMPVFATALSSYRLKEGENIRAPDSNAAFFRRKG